MKLIVYFDMDGVLANFSKAAKIPPGTWANDPPCMLERGFFRNLEVMPGAQEGVSKILEMPHINPFIASKPTTKNFYSAVEKYEWINEHFPALLKKIFLTACKSHLNGDILIDDDHHRWGKKFKGQFIHFNECTPEKEWKRIVDLLASLKQQ